MEFSRQDYWSTLLFPTPGDLPDPGIDPGLLHWQVDPLLLSHLGSSSGAWYAWFPLISGAAL